MTGERSDEGDKAEQPDATSVPDGGTGRGGSLQDIDERELWTHWVRWPDVDPDKLTEYGSPLPRGDLHIHRVCRLLPSRSIERDGGPDEFRFIWGTPRWLLRHTPLVVLAVTLVFLVSAELSPQVQGISSLLSVVWPENSLIVVAAVAPLPVLLWLLGSSGVMDFRDFGKALVVYGLGLALVVGTAVSFLMVATAEDPATLPNNIIFTSGYLLTLFVGGHVLYEGLLKIEFLFANLGSRDIVKKPNAYREFLTEFEGALRRDFLRDDLATLLPGRAGRWVRSVGEKTVSIPTSHVFAVLFSLQFGALWALRSGPQNLEFAVTLVGNVTLNTIIVIAAFQFLVVVSYFNELLNDEFVSSEGERINLTSEPFHYDGRAGFKDLGRFAIQINMLLILAALYCVYRLYVQGGRELGAEGLTGLAGFDLVAWVFSYLIPVLAFALAAGAWVYYSYWAMHRKMERDREHLCMRYQNGDTGFEGEPGAVGTNMRDFENGPEWDHVMQSPVWPLNNQRLVSMISGTLSPVVLMLPSLL